MSDYKYFYLYPCCKLIENDTEGAIYDFQREKIFKVPKSLLFVLNKLRNKPTKLTELYKTFNDKETIDSYFSYLIKNDLGRWLEDHSNFLEISNNYETPELLTHLTIFLKSFDLSTLSKLPKIMNQFLCKHFEIIITENYHFNLTHFRSVLQLFKESTLRSIDVLLPHSMRDFTFTKDEKKKLVEFCPILNRIGFYNLKKEIFVRKEKLWLTKEYYFTNLNSNNYFYKQVFICENGDVKTNPYHGRKWGSIFDSNLSDTFTSIVHSNAWNDEKAINLSDIDYIKLHNYDFKNC